MVWWTNSANSHAYRNVPEVKGRSGGLSPIGLNLLHYFNDKITWFSCFPSSGPGLLYLLPLPQREG